MQIADWLSSNTKVAAVCLIARSDRSCLVQIASCAALANAMYSASAVDRAAIGHFTVVC